MFTWGQRVRRVWRQASSLSARDLLLIAVAAMQAATLYYAASAADRAEIAYYSASEAANEARTCDRLSYSMDDVKRAADEAASACKYR